MPLIPNLRKISVNPESLFLDPNNPRLITREGETVGENHILDPDVVFRTRARMKEFRVEELKDSIRANGYVPVDYIFVRKHTGQENRYIVLEGNRRITAILELLQEENLDKTVRASVEKIEVMELLGDFKSDEFQEQITYLLGVRHHGSLKKWSPFSQANNIFVRYKEYGGATDGEFQWNSETASKVARALSVDVDEAEERLRVFVAMRQLSAHPPIARVGGLRETDYSVIGDALNNRSDALKAYFRQDHTTFLLDEPAISRFDNLCAFSNKRANATVPKPSEWSALAKILKEDDEAKKDEMLHKVEQQHVSPSVVWADRAEEIGREEWYQWLDKVCNTLTDVTLGANFETTEARDAVSGLVEVLQELDSRDTN